MAIKKIEKENTCYDKSNAYKLPKEELEKIRENPLLEFDENRKRYAEDLYKRIINTGNMPYVLLINDSFGMGKTYFITRFSLYLYQKDIDSIYISVKEQDYTNDPLVIILKKIYQFLQDGQFASDEKTIVDDIKEKISKIDITVNVPLVSASCNIGEIIEKEKNIDDLKNELGKYIEETTNKKLVLIIDDLDRCDTSYVKKFLEVLKHIFDINGLYVILMGNKNLLEKIESNDNGFNIENFSNKYIDKTVDFVRPNYNKIITEYNLHGKLKNIHKNKYSNKRNSIDELKVEAVYYFTKYNFTPREAVKLLDDLIIYAKGIDFEIDLPYLLYKVFRNRKKLNNVFGSDDMLIYPNHPLSIERMKKREKILSIVVPDFIVSGYNLKQYYSRFKNEYINIIGKNCIETIQKIDLAISKLKNEKGSIINDNYLLNVYYANDEFKQKLIELYTAKRNEIKIFYEEWQIETDENELKQKYDNLF